MSSPFDGPPLIFVEFTLWASGGRKDRIRLDHLSEIVDELSHAHPQEPQGCRLFLTTGREVHVKETGDEVYAKIDQAFGVAESAWG